MTITDISEIKSVLVETTESDYTRYSPDNWYVRMGESDEPVYNCDELEAEYQKYIKLSTKVYSV